MLPNQDDDEDVPLNDEGDNIDQDDHDALDARDFAEQQVLEALRKREEMLIGVSHVLRTKLEEAVQGRYQSGIELEWLEDEEHYQGIDDANRGEETFGMRARRLGLNNAWKFDQPAPRQGDQSTVFLNLTRAYVDTAAARVGDMLLPTDDRSWQIKPTPIPQLGVRQAVDQAIAEIGGRPDAAAIQKRLAQHDLERKNNEAAAREMAENAQRRIDDWLVQCNWHGQVRRVIDDAARLGCGVLKGPYVRKTRRIKRVALGEGGGSLQSVVENGPASKRIDPWDFFPDPACGENVHNGAYTWERDRLTPKKLHDLKGTDGYFEDMIDLCLREGPQSHVVQHDKDTPAEEEVAQSQFEVFHFYGVLDRNDCAALGVELEEDDGGPMVPVKATLVNNRVIHLALNPLDDGSFPYDVMPWTVRAGHWAGRGVGRQMRTPQRMVNAATRNMMDNAAISGGPILVIKKDGIEPEDGHWIIRPRKTYLVKGPGTAMQKAQDFLHSIQIESRQPELMSIIEFAMGMAEKVTGLPVLLQGQVGDAPDTLGGQQLAVNNASGVLRRTAKNFDDYLTEPHITRYYGFLLQYSEDPNEQGDFQIDARGSSALVEREIQNAAIAQMGAYVNDPKFKIDPAKWFEEWCRSQRLDPRRFQYDDDKWEEIQKQPAPTPPQVEVAKINAAQKQRDTQVNTALQLQLAALKYAADNNLKLQDVKLALFELMSDDRRERDMAASNQLVARADRNAERKERGADRAAAAAKGPPK